jgi:hypothetical protein
MSLCACVGTKRQEVVIIMSVADQPTISLEQHFAAERGLASHRAILLLIRGHQPDEIRQMPLLADGSGSVLADIEQLSPWLAESLIQACHEGRQHALAGRLPCYGMSGSPDSSSDDPPRVL